MNFFARKNKTIEKKKLEIEPIKLYSSLTKSKEYTYLRGIQEEVLKEWHTRRNDKELIVKMNTGAGKTLTGLLMLYSKMLESQQPVVYMCPDNQLFHQVVEQSKNYNIPTCIIENQDFPEEFLNGEAVLVTTIQRMFNGKNIFDRDKIKLKAILIDDAHKCVERIIESFTLKIAKKHDLYEKLKLLFRADLKEQSIGSYEAMTLGEPSYYMRVPFWCWLEKEKEIVGLFTEYISDKKTLLFKWDLMINNLSQYEMYINGYGIEISPMVSYIKNVTAYDTASHKYALSATFVNDYSLIKDLNFSKESITNSITPRNRMDYGQRLILTPKRYYNSLSDKQQLDIIDHHLKNKQNVVVLVSSKKKAEGWEKTGAIVADNDNLEETIEKIKSSKGKLYVFVNRYDGIDLSGDSCNVLVVHDHPRFKFLKDEYYQNIHHETNSNRIAQTLEQGMGRSVRSSSDYSVVYLVGRFNLNFLRKRKNLDFFNNHTKKQLEMGLSLLDGQKLDDSNAVSTITEIADYCLNQDDEWKTFYSNFMNKDEEVSTESRDKILQINLLEREAIYAFVKEDYEEAISYINDIISLGISDIERAWYYQIQAHIAYRLNKNTSNDLLQKARTLSIKMYQPFLGKTKHKQQFSNSQYRRALDFIQSFSTDNDLLSHIDEINKNLVYKKQNSAIFEKTLKELGELLGFKASRPEKDSKEGCDVLWFSDDYTFVIEAKSEKLPENKISKSDVEQLYHSLEWFNDKYIYNGEIIGVSFQPNNRKYDDAVVTDQIRSVSEASLEEIRFAIKQLKVLVKNNGITSLSENDIKTELEKLHFNSNQIRNKYFKIIK
ncbi:DEAD/DEAH box helicase family protein [Aquimarina sp. Aq107]|uniref:DEAD/DEAH box helicase family protein n=1 Tax=Aquimarina sp. Aq107 TaxID=1191912 RepID=UPI000D54DF00|nr:DEAD/DEAH box helicase family protein [Aquimarina sp. Aq107]